MVVKNDTRISLTLPNDIREQLVIIAEKNRRSVSQEVIVAIEEHIERARGNNQLLEKEEIRSVILQMKKEGII